MSAEMIVCEGVPISSARRSDGEAPTASSILPPVARPSSWRARLAFWYSRWRFGRVLTPIRTLYARRPGLLAPYGTLVRSELRLLALPAGLRVLVKSHIAALNGCAFCQDMARHAASRTAHAARVALVAQGTLPTDLSESERVALAYATEATLHVTVRAETLRALRAAWSEEAVVELAWLVALENFLNRITHPLGIGSDGLCEVPPQADTR